VSFIIGSLSFSFSFVHDFMISGNPIYVRRPFLMHHFLFCVFQSSLNISPPDVVICDLFVEAFNQTQYDAIFFSLLTKIDKAIWKGKHIDWLISNLWLLGNLAEPISCDKNMFLFRVNQKKFFFRGHDEKKIRLMTFWLNTDFYHPHWRSCCRDYEKKR
jgi:hypothetical protein